MVEGGIAELATERRSRPCDTIQQLDYDELGARVGESCRDAERTIEEWQEFVEYLDFAHRAMREARRGNGR
jgi:hypothetical protein